MGGGERAVGASDGGGLRQVDEIGGSVRITSNELSAVRAVESQCLMQ